MATAIATQAPDETGRRRQLEREATRVLCEIRRLTAQAEQEVIYLMQGKCPVTHIASESCEHCQNAALGNAPFVLGSQKHPHLSELGVMLDALSPALRKLVTESTAFD